MTRGNKQRKREDDRMKRLKLDMEMITNEGQRAGKRSYGKLKQGRKKFPFSSRKIATLGNTSKLSLMKAELAKMKVEMRNSAESLMASKIEANQTEAKFKRLITTRNELMDNLLEMKAIEAFLMLKLGLAFL
ncbi:hypothetical protein REPUB_Repub06bG0057900 [Reevesia pubescens]